MMPLDVTSAGATLTGPSGPIETCVLHKGNVSDGTARSILDGDNAVIVMPRQPLADGSYSATVNTNGGNVTWSFTVDRFAPLTATLPPPPDPISATPITDEAQFEPVVPFRFVDSRINLRATRLPAQTVVPIVVTTDPDIIAVSANFVSTGPGRHGYLTTYNCTASTPEVSTLNYQAGGVVANQAFVPLSEGRICLSLADTDVVSTSTATTGVARARFTPVTPVRLYDRVGRTD
jgi:hypothetical protein